jgi:D-specific alpha-keto acid dehydrogenase
VAVIQHDAARLAARHTPAPASSAPAVSTVGITIYGCARDEAALFDDLAPRFSVRPTITEAPVSEDNVQLARGGRCVSVDHKTPITNATLRALRRAGVSYLSTRSIGNNHLDVRFAERIGISVEGVTYSPDSVADYTLMLMLMALRHAKSVICRADVSDYRLNDVRGRELRDLTVGVVGTGRIGVAVLDRLRGFGCRVLTHDSRPQIFTDHVPLDELLQESDVVTLHVPLTADTHHLLDRRRIGKLKHGAVVVNTGRGALLDTEALVSALEHGNVGGAALDVLEGEEGVFYADLRNRPVSGTLLRLQAMPNVLISPHTAYYTDHAVGDMVENTLVNCLRFESRSRHGQ